MKATMRIVMALLVLTVASASPSCGDDDDDNDDAAGDDDDDNDDNDDNDDDDTTAPPEHPYTPCCDITPADVVMADPGLPAAGPGPYQAIASTYTFVDTERDREIKTQVFMPSTDGEHAATSGAPYPTVVVSHGFSGFGAMVATYGERLATWGFIAFVPNLPYTSPLALGKFSNRESALDILYLLNRACCLSKEESSAFYGLVDGGRLAVVGHSMGGKVSTLAAIYDGGVKAVVGLDPVDGSGPIDFNDPINFPEVAPDLAPQLQVPTMYLGGEKSGQEVLGQACAPVDQNFHQFWLYSPPPSIEILFFGADHTDFVSPIPFDICNVGTADANVVMALAKEYAVSFLNAQLRGWSRFRDDYAGAGIEADVDAGYVAWQEK